MGIYRTVIDARWKDTWSDLHSLQPYSIRNYVCKDCRMSACKFSKARDRQFVTTRDWQITSECSLFCCRADRSIESLWFMEPLTFLRPVGYYTIPRPTVCGPSTDLESIHASSRFPCIATCRGFFLCDGIPAESNAQAITSVDLWCVLVQTARLRGKPLRKTTLAATITVHNIFTFSHRANDKCIVHCACSTSQQTSMIIYRTVTVKLTL